MGSSYGIAATPPRGNEVTFAVTSPARYLSVHFAGPDNETPSCHWVRHMFCLFVDPLETDIPARDGGGVVVYSAQADPEALKQAQTIWFPAGYHNLRDARPGGSVSADGQLRLQDGQALYLEGGAFVEGLVDSQARQGAGQRIYGRGLLTGRQYLWRNHPDHTGPEYGHLLGVGHRARVEGVTLLESPHHGLVGGTTTITHVKLLGWHCNNDAVRVGAGSEISHCFFRPVDDCFYNFRIHVHDVVVWAGHNGAILTYGWGGESTYHSGASRLENLDVIHPEWTGLGNNNGLVAAQVGLDYRPFGYGGDPRTVLRSIRVEGAIPGLVNLKPLSSGKGIVAQPVASEKVGYLGDLLLEDVAVDRQFAKSRLEGKSKASTDGAGTFYVQNVEFRNVRIGGEWLTEANQGTFVDRDERTTRQILFRGDGASRHPGASGADGAAP